VAHSMSYLHARPDHGTGPAYANGHPPASSTANQHVGQPAPAPSVAPPAGVRPEREVAEADLRNQVVDRLRKMNVLHGQHAWERRNRDPIGPHGLAFFFSVPLSVQPLRYRLATATRMFLDGSDVDNLPRLLYEMRGIGAGFLDAGGFDPRSQMADRVESMPPDARYIGLGVSSLDTPTGAWREMLQTSDGPLNIPGRCYALLADSSRILCDRRGEREFGAFHISSTHSLDLVHGHPMRAWRFAPHLLHGEPDTKETWHWLTQLHHLIVEASR